MTTPNDITDSMTKRMDGAIHSLQHSLSGFRTGRASANLLDPIKVEIYGSNMPISQVGTINAPEARLLTVQVWDHTATKQVEKAIANSGLGLNPMTEGSIIRIPLPELSEERRKELVKKASEYSEQAKVAIRNIRRDVIDSFKKLEKNKEISEDELFNYNADVQKHTNKMVAEADKITKRKSEEIMRV